MAKKFLIALLFFAVIIAAVFGLIFNFKKDENSEEEDLAEGSQDSKNASGKIRRASSGKSENRGGDRSGEATSGQQGKEDKEGVTDAVVVE